jgi:DNA mismatch repair ATPase MutS
MGNEPPKQTEVPVKEQIREQKRNVERSMRGIEREMKKLKREEDKIIREMKKMGKNGQEKAAKTLAKDVVRTRTQVSKMNDFCGNLKAVSLRLSTVTTLNEMSDAMENANKAMSLVSSKLDPQKLNQIAKEMAKSEAKLEMNSEMMNAVMEDIGDNMDDPIQEEEVYQDLLREVGIGVSKEMDVNAPSKKKEVEVEKDSLEDMLNSLQK